MKKLYYIISFISFIFFIKTNGQGFNHVWLHGSTGLDTNVTYQRARILFDLSSDSVIGENSKMAFNGTESTISDVNGNFLFTSNGCWIMDASGDTMLNGTGINPDPFNSNWCNSSLGLPLPNACIILPYPGDSTRFVMFHHSGENNSFLSRPTKFLYTVIDMTLNGGLGGVIMGQKNMIAFQDHFSIGLSACKHANGRDWWIVTTRDSSNTVFKVLFTPNGIQSIDSQVVNMPLPFHGNAGQPCFSPDGTKFAYTSGRTGANAYHDVRIFSFDRCTGILDSIGRKRKNGEFGFGLAFSPNSKYLYYSSSGTIYQLDTDAPNIGATDTTVAVYDGYYYPYTFNYTNFWLMYLAANGKIYITSSPYTIDLHFINSPDSADTACNVQQHALRLPCYSTSGGIYHPNYYLGPVTGSICDSLGLSTQEINNDFRFRVYPNPVLDNTLNIGYLLPQNKSGIFQIYDITGKVLFKYTLPPWSNEQNFKLPKLGDGVYNCMITSGMQRASRKIAIIKQ